MFKPVGSRVSFPQMEEAILALWQKGDIFRLQGDIVRPLIYALIILILLVLRLPAIRRFIAAQRNRLGARTA